MIKPLKNYVLLEKNEADEVKVGNIILSTKKKDEGNVATVIALGEEVKNTSLNINKKVVFKEYSTTSYKENEKEYLLIKEEDILAVIE